MTIWIQLKKVQALLLDLAIIPTISVVLSKLKFLLKNNSLDRQVSDLITTSNKKKIFSGQEHTSMIRSLVRDFKVRNLQLSNPLNDDSLKRKQRMKSQDQVNIKFQPR